MSEIVWSCIDLSIIKPNAMIICPWKFAAGIVSLIIILFLLAIFFYWLKERLGIQKNKGNRQQVMDVASEIIEQNKPALKRLAKEGE